MATDIRGHTAPVGSETPRRQVFNDLSLSINDVVMAANATARQALPATFAAAGYTPTAARPLIVRQQDTAAYWEYNGTAWSLIAKAGGAGGIQIATGVAFAVTTNSSGDLSVDITGAGLQGTLIGATLADATAPVFYNAPLVLKWTSATSSTVTLTARVYNSWSTVLASSQIDVAYTAYATGL